jgi:hypothetical protein
MIHMQLILIYAGPGEAEDHLSHKTKHSDASKPTEELKILAHIIPTKMYGYP